MGLDHTFGTLAAAREVPTVNKLIAHIKGGACFDFFEEQEIGHVLTFTYNLITWIERDGADRLELGSTAFVWSKDGQVMGIFPITVPEPTPSFLGVLFQVFERDTVVQAYLHPTYEGAGVFSFQRDNDTTKD